MAFKDWELGDEASRERRPRCFSKRNPYMLFLPCIKFWLAIAADVTREPRTLWSSVLSVLTVLPTHTLHTATAVTLLLLWVFGGLLWEGQQLWAVGPRGYWADHFNRVDIVGFVLSADHELGRARHGAWRRPTSAART